MMRNQSEKGLSKGKKAPQNACKLGKCEWRGSKNNDEVKQKRPQTLLSFYFSSALIPPCRKHMYQFTVGSLCFVCGMTKRQKEDKYRKNSTPNQNRETTILKSRKR